MQLSQEAKENLSQILNERFDSIDPMEDPFYTQSEKLLKISQELELTEVTERILTER